MRPALLHIPVVGSYSSALESDGLVEVRGRDLGTGIDRLLGEAERLVPQGFAGGVERLVSRLSAGAADDRGLVLLWHGR